MHRCRVPPRRRARESSEWWSGNNQPLRCLCNIPQRQSPVSRRPCRRRFPPQDQLSILLHPRRPVRLPCLLLPSCPFPPLAALRLPPSLRQLVEARVQQNPELFRLQLRIRHPLAVTLLPRVAEARLQQNSELFRLRQQIRRPPALKLAHPLIRKSLPPRRQQRSGSRDLEIIPVVLHRLTLPRLRN